MKMATPRRSVMVRKMVQAELRRWEVRARCCQARYSGHSVARVWGGMVVGGWAGIVEGVRKTRWFPRGIGGSKIGERDEQKRGVV